MLRPSRPEDMEEIVEIWLLASLQAHDFVDASCWWQAQEDLRTRYLNRAAIWVFEERGDLLGFMALVDNYLAALFVRPTVRAAASATHCCRRPSVRGRRSMPGSLSRMIRRCASTAATASSLRPRSPIPLPATPNTGCAANQPESMPAPCFT